MGSHQVPCFNTRDNQNIVVWNRKAIRNNENLACVAVVRGLHTYLRRVSPSLDQPVAEYIKSFVKEGPGQSIRPIYAVCTEGSGGLILQTLAACDVSGLKPRRRSSLAGVLRPSLEPLAAPPTVTVHPIKQLESLCMKNGWSLKIQMNHSEKFVQAEVWINELVMGNSQNEDKKVARRLAATMALRGISHENSIVLPSKAC